jgi:hypothetical protein
MTRINLLGTCHPNKVEVALGSPVKYTAPNNIQKDEAGHNGLKKNFVDVTELIRSIQRAEGNRDCFRRVKDYCDQLNCHWRAYCIEKHLSYDGSETRKDE